jgi:hypothetical protein
MPDEEQEAEEEGLTSHGEPSFLIQLDDAEARINLLSMVRLTLFISYFSLAYVMMHRLSIAAVRHCGDASRRSSRWQSRR